MKVRDYYQQHRPLRDLLPAEVPPADDADVEASRRAALAARTGIQVEESPRIVAVGGRHG
jgi:hypothetical protein